MYYYLHCLLLNLRVYYNVLLRTYKALHEHKRQYIGKIANKYKPISTKGYGALSFGRAATLWNDLCDRLIEPDSGVVFKDRLIIHLFNNYFSSASLLPVLYMYILSVS